MSDRKQAYQGPSKSHRTESVGRKIFRVLAAPTITGPVTVNPPKPSPEYPKRHMEPTVDSIGKVVRCGERRSDKKWRSRDTDYPKGTPSTLKPSPNPSAPFTEKYYEHAIEHQEQLKAWADTMANRDVIECRYTPPAPKPSDPTGWVPKPLQFNKYIFGKYSPFRKEAQWNRDCLPDSGVPRTTFSDLLTLRSVDLDGALAELAEGDCTSSRLTYSHKDSPDELAVEPYPEEKSGPLTPLDRFDLSQLGTVERQLLEIARLRGQGLTQREIGKEFGLTRKQIRTRLDDIQRRIKNCREIYDKKQKREAHLSEYLAGLETTKP